jgi:hypothetical protein
MHKELTAINISSRRRGSDLPYGDIYLFFSDLNHAVIVFVIQFGFFDLNHPIQWNRNVLSQSVQLTKLNSPNWDGEVAAVIQSRRRSKSNANLSWSKKLNGPFILPA